MNKVIVLLVMVFIMKGAITQPCLPEGITFTTQEEIDSFQTNYPGCTIIEGNVIIQGEAINNLNGLIMLTTIGGNLSIGSYSNGTSLSSLTGLENLNSVEGDFLIAYNLSLANFTGLNNLTYIGGNYYIYGNDALTSLTGLENLSIIAGHFWIGHWNYAGNSEIYDLSGLEELILIGGDFGVMHNDALTSLAGLDYISTINGSLKIKYNNNLVNINPFWVNSLTYIGEEIFIDDNPSLYSLTGLDNVQGEFYFLTIRNNPSLYTCDILSFCKIISDTSGIIEIHDNAPGCNSPEEVEAACLTSVAEVKTLNEMIIIPNPAKGKVAISLNNDAENFTLAIFNVMGEKIYCSVLQDGQETVDCSLFPRGIYFVKTANRFGSSIQRLIIQ